MKVAISLLRSWSIERKGKDLIEPFTLGCFLFISLMYLLQVFCNLVLTVFFTVAPSCYAILNLTLNHGVVQQFQRMGI